MTVKPHRSLPTIRSLESGLCSPLVLSTSESVQLGVCLLGFCTFWSLATCYSANVRMCPLLVLSTLNSAYVWLYLHGSLSSWMFVYLDFVHLGVWSYGIIQT